MAGHSQFSNIKRKKEAQDSKRAKLFTKCSRVIEVAARGGADPDMNSKLRAAIIAARKINMPKNKIEQAIAKGSSAGAGSNYDEVNYECRHTGSGICFIVNGLTDNRNRTGSEVKHLLTKHGAVLGPVMYMFDNTGMIQYGNDSNKEAIFESAIELGALDIEEDEENVYIYTALQDFDNILGALEQRFGESGSETRLVWRAKERIDVSEQEVEKFFNLVNALEDLDDVQNVDANI